MLFFLQSRPGTLTWMCGDLATGPTSGADSSPGAPLGSSGDCRTSAPVALKHGFGSKTKPRKSTGGVGPFFRSYLPKRGCLDSLFNQPNGQETFKYVRFRKTSGGLAAEEADRYLARLASMFGDVELGLQKENKFEESDFSIPIKPKKTKEDLAVDLSVQQAKPKK